MKHYDKEDDALETSRPLLAEYEERGGDDEPDRDSAFSRILNYKTYDYLIYMAVLTIFLCFPLGVVALLFALKAHNDAVAGNYEKAKKESWTVWAIVSLAILIDLLIILIVVTVKTA